MKKKQFIALIGMPGCGKTTFGRLMAERLGWDFIDADDYIQEIAGRSISELFSEGEAVFRHWETEACRRLCEREKTVIACGGGVVLRPQNLEILRAHGRIVFIDRPVELIAGDIDISTRPLLKEGIGRLNTLYDQRYPLYMEQTEVRVENTGTHEETLDDLLGLIDTELKVLGLQRGPLKIAIVGLGVIGGSFALALKESGYEEVYGVDSDQDTLDKALSMDVILKGSCEAKDILPLADLTILAIYPLQIKSFLAANREYFKPGSILTDVTGVKGPMLIDIEQWMPHDVDFILGHPMAGREKKGIDFASAQVFKGANYILTPTPSNREENLKKIEDLVMSLGFKRVRRITPVQHDEIIAFTSQLPHAMAVALVNSDKPDRGTGQFVGDSYRELTRIANINGELWSELFIENRNPLLKAIADFEKELDRIKTALERMDKDELISCFDQSSQRRAKLD